jgi:hypothetical protein
MGGYTRDISGQRLGKHVPAAIETSASIEELFSMWSGPKCYKEGTRLDPVNYVQDLVKRGLEPEAEE